MGTQIFMYTIVVVACQLSKIGMELEPAGWAVDCRPFRPGGSGLGDRGAQTCRIGRTKSVQNPTPTRQVQTFSAQLRTFWALLERVFGIIFGQNPDIRLKTGVPPGWVAGLF